MKKKMRPISDLYRPIIHNGKRVTPIVELARIALSGRRWVLCPDYAECGREIFFYCEERECFIAQYDNCVMVVPRQRQLFDYMDELNIDYRIKTENL